MTDDDTTKLPTFGFELVLRNTDQTIVVGTHLIGEPMFDIEEALRAVRDQFVNDGTEHLLPGTLLDEILHGGFRRPVVTRIKDALTPRHERSRTLDEVPLISAEPTEGPITA